MDDDHDVLAANARFLRVNDFDVVVADRVEAAMQRLAEERVDVIVTDLVMPGENGIVFARRAREVHPFVPVLFFSGFARVPDVVAAMRLGAVDFLEKPVEPEELLSRLLTLDRDQFAAAPRSCGRCDERLENQQAHAQRKDGAPWHQARSHRRLSAPGFACWSARN